MICFLTPDQKLIIHRTMKLGLVCISELLRDKHKNNSFCTMTRKRFNDLPRQEAINQLDSRIAFNASFLWDVIDHCAAHGIKHYRVSSNLAPLITDPTLDLSLDDLPQIETIKKHLRVAGDYARKVGVTLSSHPDQFNVLPSLNPDTVERTIRELNHQSHILDLMGCPKDYSAPMCLHLGLSPKPNENIEDYISRFYSAFYRCDVGVCNRLVLENEDKGYWNCKKLFDIFGGDFPLVFDNLHHACNNPHNLSTEECIEAFSKTWGASTPVFHWSEGINGTRKHTDYFSHVPQFVYDNPNIVFECEVKAKDKAICDILMSELKTA